MRKIFIALIVFSVPTLLFLTVWQSFRYSNMQKDIKKLEIVQEELFEDNKKTVMGIEFLKSPYRINKIAEEDLQLKKVDQSDVIRIEILDEGDRKRE